MVKPKEKLFEKIEGGRNNARIEELVSLMTSYGFGNRRNVHAYMFQHPLLKGVTIAVAIPHGRENKVLRKYVDNCLNAIEQLLEVQNE
jgi:hypothetical protein